MKSISIIFENIISALMCSALSKSIHLPVSIVRSLPIASVRPLCSGNSNGSYTDINTLAKLWNRAPLRNQNYYPKDQKQFWFSRDPLETPEKYKRGLCVGNLNNVMFYKYRKFSKYAFLNHDWIVTALSYADWLTARARIQLLENHLPQVDDVVNGGRHVFSTILKAVINRNVDSLAPLVLGNGVIDAHRKGSWKLTEKQRQSLQVTEDDFIGFNGIVYNWNGFQTATSNLSRMIHDTWMVHKDALGKSLENPYFKYSIILGAILRKNELYDMVRSLPYNPSSERMVLRMPAGYGYVTPRHIIMKIDLCHEVTQEYPVELCEDAMIYDFHIHSF